MKRIEEKVIKFIKENDLISKGDKIIVALSGGPDSVFLLHFLNKFRKKYQLQLCAFHLNHMLRGRDATGDQNFCKELCKDLNVKFFTKKTNVKLFAKKSKMSVEEAGRSLRYKELNSLCKTKNYNKIATAHIADDNAETVLLNLVKGTGLTGITGIPVKRENIIRPILSISKSEVLDYLHLNKIAYRIDETNLDTGYERNYLRNEIIPRLADKLNPNIIESIFTGSKNLARIKNFIDDELIIKSRQIEDRIKNGISYDLYELKKIRPFLLSEYFYQSLKNKFKTAFGNEDVKKIISVLNKQTGTKEKLKENIYVIKERGTLLILKQGKLKTINEVIIKTGEVKKILGKSISIYKCRPSEIKFSSNKNVEFVDSSKLKGNLILRTWQNGDRFKPFGMKGTKKISDYLNDIKISAIDKKNQLVLVNNKKIVWVVGKRLDASFAVSSSTKKVYKLCLK